jgi:peptidase family S54; rhomboid family protein
MIKNKNIKKELFQNNLSLNKMGNLTLFFKKMKFSIFIYIIMLAAITVCSLFQLNVLAIKPLDFDSLWNIGTSWLTHENFEHYKNNMIILSQLLLVFLLVEKNKSVLILLILFSGFFTWLLGGNGLHLGASGLIFALIGYMFLSIFRNVWYLIFIIVMSSQLFYIVFHGLIPSQEISFSGHFGGFISGLLIAYFANKNRKNISLF